MKNTLAPINQIPPEILTLIPDSWEKYDKDQGIITLTHTCRAWREMFISRSSLWTDFRCEDTDKTRVYLERSKSSPIDLWIERYEGLSPDDPFLEIDPGTIRRLKSLFIYGSPEVFQVITARLSHPVPLLESLDIEVEDGSELEQDPVLISTLFDGDLSSLRMLRLLSVRTVLPWRNMVNLTSFTLGYTSSGEVSIKQLLDFFESAPRLCKVRLNSATPIFGAQSGRLVSLACLEKMEILKGEPPSLLLDHLLIPVGAELITRVDSFGHIDDHLPRSLDNLRNLSNFTKIYLSVSKFWPHLQFSGPSGKFSMTASRVHTALSVLEFLARFDTSKTERLKIAYNNPPSEDPHQALLPMEGLHTLTLFRCQSPHTFTDVLHPSMSSEVVVCPRLEELIFVPRTNEEDFEIERVINMAAARASRGAKLARVRILDKDGKFDPGSVLELGKHVLHVECGPGVDVINDDRDDSDDDSDDSEELVLW